MSRSYRKPFMAITGCGSAKRDKVCAHRAVRRAQNHAIKNAFLEDSFEDFLLPHIYECSYNDVWGWNRDGDVRYCGLDGDSYNNYLLANSDISHWCYADPRYTCWPPEWYKEMLRK